MTKSDIFDVKVDKDQAFLKLHPVMDMAIAEPFLEASKKCVAHEKNVILLGEDVERLSTPCIQIMMVTANALKVSGRHFYLSNPSAEFQKSLEVLGLQEAMNEWRIK